MKQNNLLFVITLFVLLASCKKEHNDPDPIAPPAPVQTKKILLKDMVLPRLPSPYYHFEYGADSLVARVEFASGFTMYDVLYHDGKVAEMRNNIFVNHDTLRYA